MKPSTHKQNREELFLGSSSIDSSVKRDPVVDSENRNRNLLQAHSEMANELQRMRVTASVIEDSSKTIHSIDSRYNDYRNAINSAGKALKQLRKKMESDDRYIYFSFLFFIFTAGWIFMKRIGILRMVHWLAAQGFYGASYIADFTGGVVVNVEQPMSTALAVVGGSELDEL